MKKKITKVPKFKDFKTTRATSSALEKILYNYSNFNVITIDSFTNNIINSIDESNHNEDSLVELDSDIYIDLAIDELISEIDGNEELKNLLIEFAKFKITVNKNCCERKFRWGWITNCLKPCLMDRYTYNKFHH